MPDDRFLEESLPRPPTVTPSVTDGPPTCCLCRDPITSGMVWSQRFETDPSGTLYSAHAICAHEYVKVVRAYLSAFSDVTP